MDSTTGTKAPNFSAGVHIDPDTLIKVVQYPQSDQEPVDRVVLQIGPSLKDFSLFLDREDCERLHAIIAGAYQWFVDQAAARALGAAAAAVSS